MQFKLLDYSCYDSEYIIDVEHCLRFTKNVTKCFHSSNKCAQTAGVLYFNLYPEQPNI